MRKRRTPRQNDPGDDRRKKGASAFLFFHLMPHLTNTLTTDRLLIRFPASAYSWIPCPKPCSPVFFPGVNQRSYLCPYFFSPIAGSGAVKKKVETKFGFPGSIGRKHKAGPRKPRPGTCEPEGGFHERHCDSHGDFGCLGASPVRHPAPFGHFNLTEAGMPERVAFPHLAFRHRSVIKEQRGGC